MRKAGAIRMLQLKPRLEGCTCHPERPPRPAFFAIRMHRFPSSAVRASRLPPPFGFVKKEVGAFVPDHSVTQCVINNDGNDAMRYFHLYTTACPD